MFYKILLFLLLILLPICVYAVDKPLDIVTSVTWGYNESAKLEASFYVLKEYEELACSSEFKFKAFLNHTPDGSCGAGICDECYPNTCAYKGRISISDLVVGGVTCYTNSGLYFETCQPTSTPKFAVGLITNIYKDDGSATSSPSGLGHTQIINFFGSDLDSSDFITLQTRFGGCTCGENRCAYYNLDKIYFSPTNDVIITYPQNDATLNKENFNIGGSVTGLGGYDTIYLKIYQLQDGIEVFYSDISIPVIADQWATSLFLFSGYQYKIYAYLGHLNCAIVENYLIQDCFIDPNFDLIEGSNSPILITIWESISPAWDFLDQDFWRGLRSATSFYVDHLPNMFWVNTTTPATPTTIYTGITTFGKGFLTPVLSIAGSFESYFSATSAQLNATSSASSTANILSYAKGLNQIFEDLPFFTIIFFTLVGLLGLGIYKKVLDVIKLIRG